MSRKRKRGITNKQASYLAALQRDLGVPYSGNGMTIREATDAIEGCLEKLEARRGKRRRLPGASPRLEDLARRLEVR